MENFNEDERYRKYMKTVKELDLNDFAPPIQINHTESPFTWIKMLKPNNLCSSDYIVKMDDYINQGDSYTFEKFIPYLALAFEYALLKNFKEAKYFLNKVEEMFFTMESKNECFYFRIKPAMEHVFVATKTNIFILENEESEKIEILKEKCSLLKPVIEMEEAQQAAIHALKSKFFLTCTTENELALSHMMEACKLDPKCATWTYWAGKICRKIRRDKKEYDPKEELDFFVKAVSMERDAKHLVFLAQAYREKSNYLHKIVNSSQELSKDYNEIDKLREKACDLYMESAELNPTSAAICRRAGNGLMSLPKPYAKYSLAKHLLHKSETLSRNPVTFHILGTFYSRYHKDLEKAAKYFKKTADSNMVYGFHELIKIKYINDPNYDPLEDLLHAEKCLEYSGNLQYIEGDIGWYYMIVKNDLLKGLEYFMKIIEKDEDTTFLKKFYSYSFLVKGPLNLFEVLREKVLDVKEEDRNEIMIRFLEKVNCKPELLDSCEGCVTLNKAQREANITLKWQRQQEDKTKRVDNQNRKPDRNWRETSLPVCTVNDKTSSADRAKPKQENWRLECRKF